MDPAEDFSGRVICWAQEALVSAPATRYEEFATELKNRVSSIWRSRAAGQSTGRSGMQGYVQLSFILAVGTYSLPSRN